MKSKSKILPVLIILIILFTLTALLAACGDPKHTHSYVHHPAVSATCTTDGNIEYWSYSGCDKNFSDDKGTELTGSTVVAATHTLVNNKCTVCDAVMLTEGLNYTLNADGESYTVSGMGTSQDIYVNIPSTYEGKPVTHIANIAFANNVTIEILIIPDSVNSIGNKTFGFCIYLTSIIIPNSVTSIDGDIFFYCDDLNEIYYHGTCEEWERITIIGDNFEINTSATFYYYSETQPTVEGNYWHYVDEVVTKW